MTGGVQSPVIVISHKESTEKSEVSTSLFNFAVLAKLTLMHKGSIHSCHPNLGVSYIILSRICQDLYALRDVPLLLRGGKTPQFNLLRKYAYDQLSSASCLKNQKFALSFGELLNNVSNSLDLGAPGSKLFVFNCMAIRPR